MRYHFDTEFDENGEVVIPISFGAVAEDGRELYLINHGYLDAWHFREPYYWKGKYLADPNSFVVENVLDKISPQDNSDFGVPEESWSDFIYEFLTAGDTIKDIELWAYYAAYDHIVYAQSFGKMIDIPEPLPWYTNDDMTIRKGQPAPFRDPELFPEHHALSDAKFQKFQWECWMGLHDRI